MCPCVEIHYPGQRVLCNVIILYLVEFVETWDAFATPFFGTWIPVRHPHMDWFCKGNQIEFGTLEFRCIETR